MTFPTPYTVDWFPYTGGPETVDELGNETESWSETATSKPVQGWEYNNTDRLTSNVRGEIGAISEVVLSVPPDWTPGMRDRVELPDQGIYEVTGISLQCNGFHGWQPGNLVMLKRAQGV